MGIYGMTLPPSTLDRDVASILSRLGFPAKASRWLVDGAATKTRVISGLTLPASSPSASQLSFFSKTCQGLCRWDCATCAPIYEAWVLQFQQDSSARQNVVRRTSASGSSFWPTPTTPSGGQVVPPDARWETPCTAYRKDGSKATVNLSAAVAHWTDEKHKEGTLLNPQLVERLQGFPDGWTDGRTA